MNNDTPQRPATGLFHPNLYIPVANSIFLASSEMAMAL